MNMKERGRNDGKEKAGRSSTLHYFGYTDALGRRKEPGTPGHSSQLEEGALGVLSEFSLLQRLLPTAAVFRPNSCGFWHGARVQ